MPRTAPSSYAVSETALAAPAFSGGALERMSSFDTVSAMPMPMPSATNAAVMRRGRCLRRRSRATTTYPTTESVSALGTMTRGDQRFEIGTTMRPAAIMAARPGHERQARLERAEAHDQLQVLRDEEEEPHQRDDAQQVDEERAAERPAAGRGACRASACSARSWRRTNRMPNPTPTANSTAIVAVKPCTASSLIA